MKDTKRLISWQMVLFLFNFCFKKSKRAKFTPTRPIGAYKRAWLHIHIRVAERAGTAKEMFKKNLNSEIGKGFRSHPCQESLCFQDFEPYSSPGPRGTKLGWEGRLSIIGKLVVSYLIRWALYVTRQHSPVVSHNLNYLSRISVACSR